MIEKVKVSVLARLLDLTNRRIQQLATEDVIPKPVGGFYDLARCVTGYIHFLRSGGDRADFQDIKAKHLNQRTVKLQIETSKLEGSLVDRAAYQEALDRAAGECQRAFRGFPWAVVPILAKMPKGEDGQFDERLGILVVDTLLRDCWRHSLCQQPRPKTPTVNYWDRDLLSLGVVKADEAGEVIVASTVYPFKKRCKAADLLAATNFDIFWHGQEWIENQKRVRDRKE